MTADYPHSVTVQGRTKDVQVRPLGENVLFRIEPDGTVVLDAELFDALVQRVVARADELGYPPCGSERKRADERQRAQRAW